MKRQLRDITVGFFILCAITVLAQTTTNRAGSPTISGFSSSPVSGFAPNPVSGFSQALVGGLSQTPVTGLTPNPLGPLATNVTTGSKFVSPLGTTIGGLGTNNSIANPAVPQTLVTPSAGTNGVEATPLF